MGLKQRPSWSRYSLQTVHFVDIKTLVILQVPPFRKLREEKTSGRRTKCTELVYYDFKQMQAAFTGTVPILGDANPYSGRVSVFRGAS